MTREELFAHAINEHGVDFASFPVTEKWDFFKSHREYHSWGTWDHTHRVLSECSTDCPPCEGSEDQMVYCAKHLHELLEARQ